MIYYVVFWFLAILAFFEVFMKQRKVVGVQKKIAIVLIAIILVALAGLREGVGIDIRSYYQDFLLIKNGTLSVSNINLELGYSLLNYISPSFRWLLLTMAILCVGIRFKAFKKNQIKYLVLAIFFYYGTDYLFYDMGIMRQGLSISICLFSLPMVEKRDKRFFIYIVIAALFHISAFLFVLIWFISNKEYTRRFYCTCIGVATVFFLGGIVYTGILNQIINSIGSAYLKHKFNKYMTYSQVDLTISFVRRVVFLILFVEAFKRRGIRLGSVLLPKRQVKDTTWLHINGYFLSVVLFGIFTPLFSSVAGRMTSMFYTLHSFVYCDMLEDKHQQIANLVWFIAFTLLLFETFNGSVNDVNGNYLPYAWSW